MYVHALQQHDKRPVQPVVIACNRIQLQKKIIYESMLEEERMLHAHSADNATGGYDGGGPITSYPNELTFLNENITFEGDNLTYSA
jgi:hypothetical protein